MYCELITTIGLVNIYHLTQIQEREKNNISPCHAEVILLGKWAHNPKQDLKRWPVEPRTSGPLLGRLRGSARVGGMSGTVSCHAPAPAPLCNGAGALFYAGRSRDAIWMGHLTGSHCFPIFFFSGPSPELCFSCLHSCPWGTPEVSKNRLLLSFIWAKGKAHSCECRF